MGTTTTRRNLLRIGTTAAAYAAGASIVTGGVALASQAKGASTSAYESAFARWKANLAIISKGEATEDQIAVCWGKVDAAETFLMEADQRSPRLAAILLWLSLEHRVSSPADELAVRSENIRHFIDNGGHLDWDAKLHVRGLRALVEAR